MTDTRGEARGRVVVGTRGSRLARLQAQLVVAELSQMSPGSRFDVVSITTTGDRRRRATFGEMGETGVFVKEIEESLSAGRIDMAVHSLKDVPTETTSGLHIAAVTERDDPRDVLVSGCGGLGQLPIGARVGTGSPRRAIQILSQRPDIEVCPLRGNIDTRLRKVASGDMQGVVLAAAALLRLGLEDRIAEYLPPGVCVPAVGQGALAIQVRADDTRMLSLASSVNHEPTWRGVTAERAFLSSLGGGCREPIAALGTASDGAIHLQGMVASSGGGRILRAEISGSDSEPEEIGDQLASKMLEMGAASLIGGGDM